jgi:hypothetical protein
MKIKSESIALIAILAVTLFLAGTLFTYHGMKTILVPAIICGFILILGAVQLSKEFMASAKAAGHDTDSSKAADEAAEEEKQKTIKYLEGLGWLVGFGVAIYLIGFMYGTCIFLCSIFRFNGKYGWFKSVTIAVLGTAVFWFVFIYLLQTDLWGGAIFNWFNLNLPTLTEI